MNQSEQQKQTKEFFQKISEQWHYIAEHDIEGSFDIGKLRSQYMEKICSNFLNNKAKVLDVGCGTGNLVVRLLKKGYQAIGIDFASSMIKKAKSEANKLNLPDENFIHSSFFEFKPDSKFNLICASGFIEYISPNEFTDFINISRKFLKKNGLLCFQSRNRLFNCISFNDYTKAEIKLGEINNLLEECILFNESKSLEDLLKKNFTSKISKNLTKHGKTGNQLIKKIDVETRYQYTPFQIISKLQKNKFKVIDLIPLHIHAIPTGAKETNPDIHKKISNFLQIQNNFIINLMPIASSFMILAKKN